ncbi:hypothetical protein P7C70_g2252, partial [Phenoliferia sp. Uapishka_3]
MGWSRGAELPTTRPRRAISSPPRRTSLFSPTASNRRKARKLILSSLFLVLIYAIYKSTFTPPLPNPISPQWGGDQASVLLDRRDNEDCDTFPWRAECGTTGSDSFSGLEYQLEGGHLFYPAASPSSTPNTKLKSPTPAGQPHPIHLLMSQAQQSWRKKLSRQSKSLPEAITEYTRRYNRPPPLHFPAWYAFATRHKFRLIDEFDSLHARIEPYYALPSTLLRARSERLQNDKELWLWKNTFTIEIRKAKDKGKGNRMKVRGPMSKGVNERPEQAMELLRGIVGALPEMNITFTGHDTPFIALSGEIRQKMIEAAAAGKCKEFFSSLRAPQPPPTITLITIDLDESLYESNLDDWAKDGWAMMCSPSSPLRNAPKFEERKNDWIEPRASFIEDHVKAMDLYQYDIPIGDDPPWEKKTLNQVIWRGSTTGANLDNPHMRKWSQRPRLCSLHSTPGKLTVPISSNDTSATLGPMKETTFLAKALGNAYFDFKFYGEPVECHDPAACDEFRKKFTWAEWQYQEDQNMFKLLASRLMVLKSTIFPEWYSDHIQPWVHYVPVSTDYSDLWSIMAFFRGDRHGVGAHDDLAKHIALAGKDWAEKSWRMVDMQVYLFRLLIERSNGGRLFGRGRTIRTPRFGLLRSLSSSSTRQSIGRGRVMERIEARVTSELGEVARDLRSQLSLALSTLPNTLALDNTVRSRHYDTFQPGSYPTQSAFLNSPQTFPSHLPASSSVPSTSSRFPNHSQDESDFNNGHGPLPTEVEETGDVLPAYSPRPAVVGLTEPTRQHAYLSRSSKLRLEVTAAGEAHILLQQPLEGDGKSWLEGQLRVTLPQPESITHIKIRLKGVIRTMVMRVHGSGRHPVSEDVLIWEDGSTLWTPLDEEQARLQGTFVFPFRLHLPARVNLTSPPRRVRLPPSFVLSADLPNGAKGTEWASCRCEWLGFSFVGALAKSLSFDFKIFHKSDAGSKGLVERVAGGGNDAELSWPIDILPSSGEVSQPAPIPIVQPIAMSTSGANNPGDAPPPGIDIPSSPQDPSLSLGLPPSYFAVASRSGF